MENGGPVSAEQYQELFRTAYARYLSQGLEPNDAVARALLEMQQTTENKAAETAEQQHEDIKMEEAGGDDQEREYSGDIEMETLKPASTAAVANELAATCISPAAASTATTAHSHTTAPTTGSKVPTGASNGNGSAQNVTAVSPMGTQLEDALNLATESQDYRVVKRLVYQIFSDPDVLSAAFVRDIAEQDDAKAKWWCIDRDQVGRVFTLLDAAMAGSDQEALQNTFRNALEMLATQPWNVCSTWHSPRFLRFFLVLFEHPAMFDPDYLNVVGGLCRLFYYLSEDAKALVRAQWMKFFSVDELHRLLDILQQAITVCLYGSRKMDLVYAACGVLAELHVVNRERVNGTEPFATYDEFYNDAVNSEVDIVQDYSRSIIFWKKRRAAARSARRMEHHEQRRLRQEDNGNADERRHEDQQRQQEELKQDAKPMPERMLSEMSFCDFPFVLDAASKSKVLQIDSDLEQRARAQDAVLSRSMMLLDTAPSPYLILKVRRENIVEDAMQQLVHLSSSSETLKKPLKVKFVGEEGIDEGGVQKEFFQILIRQLLDPAYGMFTYDEETRTLWFNSDSLEATMEYELIGTLLGLAIYNSVILDVSFPHIVYKKIMGCSLGLGDLEVALPELGRGLRQMLNFQGNIEEVYQRNFEYSYEVFGEVKTVELKPGGSSTPVTNENREEYVALYVDYVLNTSVARQYSAFHHGFHQVCNREVLSMFRWEELQLLVCGSSDLDFDALEEATHYEDGFTEDSNCIRDFWVIVHALPLEDKKKLLRFATGSDRVPIRGLSNLVFVISRNGPDSDRLPTAHTCFNHLLLPEYSSREKLKERLLLAINQAEGFGLR
ncbi:putative E3 ubiquitin-protein ligase HTD2 [Phytophthora boehmeriae]|uniref:HECT-type E3 ubiquitin transferase n=1 Tax=Phytophthora boehmeriae TaxID=109152 RepID=A0A8T1WUM0_9STRA|nr:putative E3 ubiquitin-protein ligase HTD2 [Phytophthora boehmeriae]